MRRSRVSKGASQWRPAKDENNRKDAKGAENLQLQMTTTHLPPTDFFLLNPAS